MKIGNLDIKGKVLLAPMAGVADRAFRELCAGYGAALVTGEMVSCKGLCYHDRKSAELLTVGELERPAGVQLFGDDPDLMAKAAGISLAYKPDFIDINMGCPAPKIAHNGAGSALLRDPALCGRITKAVVQVSPVPVTVKIRKGFSSQSVTAVEVAKQCEAAGCSAIAVHGRTRDQMYAPPVDRSIIAAVKRAVSVPVIGNGDICTPLDASAMLEETGCDAVMVGRGALGSPWIFSQMNAWLDHGQILPDPPLSEKMRVLLVHIARMCELKGEKIGMLEARKHSAWYMKGMTGAANLRKQAGSLTVFDDLTALLSRILTEREE